MNFELQVVFPDHDITATAVARDLSVDFDHGIESIRIRSTETVVNAIKRNWPTCQVWQGERRLA